MGGFGSRAPHPYNTPKSCPIAYLCSTPHLFSTPTHSAHSTKTSLESWLSMEQFGNHWSCLIPLFQMRKVMHSVGKGLPSITQLANNRAWNAGKEPHLCACTCTNVVCFSLSSQVLTFPTPSCLWFCQFTFSYISLTPHSLHHVLSFNSYCLSQG